ncbi:hypothetical protein PFISCL1PPCAC_22580, partial [Pristionchus fissidentatus]
PVPEPMAPPHAPHANKEALFNDYFATPAKVPDPLPLPGQNLPDQPKSNRVHSSVVVPSAEEEKKKTDPDQEKKPSGWTQPAPAHRKDFKKPSGYEVKTQKDATRPLSSEPTSNNVEDEKSDKKKKKDKGLQTDNMDELRRLAE